MPSGRAAQAMAGGPKAGANMTNAKILAVQRFGPHICGKDSRTSSRFPALSCQLLYHFYVHPLAERLLKTIRKQELVRAGDRLAVAVSGGADSLALLSLSLELRAELGIVLSVAHVNHKLRGEESDEDQQFVARLALEHRLELHVCTAAVDAWPNSKAGSGTEATARHLRYSFFRRLAQDGKVTRIATAHTLDDQAETVLLRMFRGTGIRGLSGIHPRIIFEHHGRTFGEVVRPLLDLRHASLQDYLRERGQSWREDSSNRDVVFLRNRVRHRLLPMIAEQFGEAVIEHLSELAEIARAEEEHWEQGHPEIAAQLEPTVQVGEHAENAETSPGNGTDAEDVEGDGHDPRFVGHCFSHAASSPSSNAPLGAGRRAGLPLRPLLGLPLATQRRLLRGWLEANAPGLSISFRIIEEALELARGAVGRKFEMPGAWILRLGRQQLLLESEFRSDHVETSDYEYPLTVPGTVEIPELGACIEARMADAMTISQDEREQLLDNERVPDKILIRNWRVGDRYWPAHSSAPKKIKELLSERHITGAEKKRWPVAVAEGIGVIWMRGFAVPAALQSPAGRSQAILIRERRRMP